MIQYDGMKVEIRIEVLEVDKTTLDRSVRWPDGVSFSGPFSYVTNTAPAPDGAMALMLLDNWRTLFLVFVLPLAANVTAPFLVDAIKKFLANNASKRIRVNGKEIDINQGDLERIIAENMGVEYKPDGKQAPRKKPRKDKKSR